MAALALIITTGGLNKLVAAAGGGTAAVIAEVGLTESHFAPSAATAALPGEFTRVDTIAGVAISPSTIHLTVRDSGTDSYDLRGFALYLADGTLFASYSQADPIFTKADLSTFLLQVDVTLSSPLAQSITFGDASFVDPPASETVKGVVELATVAEAQAGTDTARAVTPAGLKAAIGDIPAPAAPPVTSVNNKTGDVTLSANDVGSAPKGRKITGGGLITGGGDLTGDRELDVTAATAADLAAATAADRAVTPAALGGLLAIRDQNGCQQLPGGVTVQWGRFTAYGNDGRDAVTYVAFPHDYDSAAWSVVVSGAHSDSDPENNNPAVIPSTISAAGFQVRSGLSGSMDCCFQAWGMIAEVAE